VEVFEYGDERPRLRGRLEQRAHRAVAAVALVLEPHGGGGRERRQRRKDVRKLNLHVVVEHREPLRAEALEVLLQGRSAKTESGRSRSSSDAEPKSTS
jgi:hypothetical protein